MTRNVQLSLVQGADLNVKGSPAVSPIPLPCGASIDGSDVNWFGLWLDWQVEVRDGLGL